MPRFVKFIISDIEKDLLNSAAYLKLTSGHFCQSMIYTIQPSECSSVSQT